MIAQREMHDALNRAWTNISSEIERRYIFPGGDQITIWQPQLLNVSESGSHRVSSADGTCYYIPPDWNAIMWRVKPGQPHFVK